MEQVDQTDADHGVLWWLKEHAIAERAVTIASAILDESTDPRVRELWSNLLDIRLDRLEVVEDVCDAIISRLRETEPPWVADAVAAHWIKGCTIAEAARVACMSRGHFMHMSYRALRRLDAEGFTRGLAT